jgi:integrase
MTMGVEPGAAGIVLVHTAANQIRSASSPRNPGCPSGTRAAPHDEVGRGQRCPRRVTRRSRSSRSTPVPGSAKSSPSKSTTSARSARKGVLRLYGKGERVRQVPIHPQLHTALTGWPSERAGRPGAHDNPALLLNQRGRRLRVKGAHDIITTIAARAGLDDDITAHVLRHTFATTLVRGWRGSSGAD